MLTLAEIKTHCKSGPYVLPLKEGIHVFGDTIIKLGSATSGNLVIGDHLAEFIFDRPVPRALAACDTYIAVSAVEVNESAAFAKTVLGKYKISAEKVDD